MAKKRFTDIEIWDREWYMELAPKHKCLIKYIFDKCDASGCWKPNWKLASLHINESVNLSDLNKIPSHQFEILTNGKIYIPDFIKFQYGKLSEKSPAHNPVFEAIEKNNLSDRVFNRVSDTPKEKDKDKEEERDKEKKGIVKGKQMPNASDFNGLPEIKIGAAKELIRITNQKDVSDKDIKDIWEVFKIQTLTGKKYYQDEEDVYSHFINWIKKQDFKDGTKSNSSSTKLGTSAARTKTAENW